MTLNYSAFAQAFRKVAIDGRFTPMARTLLRFSLDAIEEKTGKLIDVNRRVTHPWFEGTSEVEGIIVTYALNDGSFDRAVEAMNQVLAKEIQDNKIVNFLDELSDLIENDSSIPEDDKKVAISYYQNGEDAEFVAKALQIALKAPNKTKPAPSHKKKEDGEIAEEVIAKLNKHIAPKEIPIPPDIKDCETEYVNAILEAIADHEGVSTVSREDLNAKPEYVDYEKDFELQRQYFYAAESLRMAERDSETLRETHGFEKIENEMYDCVIDTLITFNGTGYMRMHKVLDKSTSVALYSPMTKYDGLVSVKSKKGLCHMLVKDKKVRWKK